MVFRIKIEDRTGGKTKHLLQFTVDELGDIPSLIENSGAFLESSERRACKMVIDEHNKKEKEFFNSDLFDKKSVGKDITPENFLKNEVFFDLCH